jgi:hypothetical protein
MEPPFAVAPRHFLAVNVRLGAGSAAKKPLRARGINFRSVYSAPGNLE